MEQNFPHYSQFLSGVDFGSNRLNNAINPHYDLFPIDKELSSVLKYSNAAGFNADNIEVENCSSGPLVYSKDEKKNPSLTLLDAASKQEIWQFKDIDKDIRTGPDDSESGGSRMKELSKFLTFPIYPQNISLNNLLPITSNFNNTSTDVAIHKNNVIDTKEIILQSKIGEGFYGYVWAAKWNDLPVAVKELKIGVRKGEVENFRSEVAVLSTLRHPNITIYYGVTSPPHSMIITELLGGSLYQVAACIH